MLARMLQARDRGLTIIFARTKRTVAKVAEDLTDRGFAVGALHGDLGQGAREQAMRAFRKGKVDVLVATDVAARGIDVDDVTHVVNYQCPEDEKTYLHRIGRTGRAGNIGTAVTFVDWDDLPRWAMIDKALDLGIPEPRGDVLDARRTCSRSSTSRRARRGALPRAARTRAGLDAEDVEDLGETGRFQKGAKGPRGKRREAAPADDAATERTARPASNRQRRRTRGGVPMDGTTVTAQSTNGANGSEADVVELAPETATADAGERRPRRRRRRRGSGQGSGTSVETADVAVGE